MEPRNQQRTRPTARTPRNNKGMLFLVVLLVAGIVLAGIFIVAVLVHRMQTTAVEPTPSATLRPTFTPVAPSDAPPTEAVATAPSEGTATPVGAETATPVEATQPPSTEPPPGGPVRMKSPDYGMQAFLWWRPEVAQRDMELIRDAGFGWVKQIFSWREIEGGGKGHFDWSTSDRVVAQAESIGVRIIARLDSEPTWASGRAYPSADNVLITPPRDVQDFADFCYALASRYKGRIGAYQLWNEPNLSREWGGRAPDPDAYTRLLKAGYEAIKRADPHAIVISAGLAPTTRWDDVAMPDTEYLKLMYAAGAEPYFDALGAHGAGYRAPPEMDPGTVANDPNYYNRGDPYCPGPACRIYCFRHVEDLRQIMVENGDADKQVVVLEFGWTIDPRPDSPYAWHAVTEEQQAAYFVGAYQYAVQHWQPWIGIMSLIYMPDVDWTEDDEQYWWSIAVPNYPQFLPRKAYRDLAPMQK